MLNIIEQGRRLLQMQGFTVSWLRKFCFRFKVYLFIFCQSREQVDQRIKLSDTETKIKEIPRYTLLDVKMFNNWVAVWKLGAWLHPQASTIGSQLLYIPGYVGWNCSHAWQNHSFPAKACYCSTPALKLAAVLSFKKKRKKKRFHPTF